MQGFLADSVCALSSYIYKVMAAIGNRVLTFSLVLFVLDTGAGPNLVRSSALPTSLRKRADKSRVIVNLQYASQHKLAMLGVVHLLGNVGDCTTLQPFVVVRNLAVQGFLGCTFIDYHVEEIRIRQQ